MNTALARLKLTVRDVMDNVLAGRDATGRSPLAFAPQFGGNNLERTNPELILQELLDAMDNECARGDAL